MQETRASRVCALASRGLQFRRSPRGNQCKDRLPLSRNFHISTHVNCTRLNEIEAVYGRSRVDVKVERGQLLHLRVTFHTLPLFHSGAYNLRAYLCESSIIRYDMKVMRQWKSTLRALLRNTRLLHAT